MISLKDKLYQKMSIEQELIHLTFPNLNEKYDIYLKK